MPTDLLRVAAFASYLGAWVVFALGAGAGLVRRGRAETPLRISAAGAAGTVLQVAAGLAVTLSMGDRLRPNALESLGALVLAPAGSWVFVWALFSEPRGGPAHTLVTQGAYRWLRHPMYAAFFGMLVATGCVVSAGWKLAAAGAAYIAGSELRIRAEETELAQRFGAAYDAYRRQTRWRYLPGLR